MIITNSPDYDGFQGRGLVAHYSLDFATDFTYSIPLTGSWQGDPVKAVTLHVNNYYNACNLTVTVNNLATQIPAYSDAYVTVANSNAVAVVSDLAISVDVEVLSYFVPDKITLRTVIPGEDTDPLFDDVIGLWHFDANNQTLVGVNSKSTANNTNWVFGNSGHISTAQSVFGGSSAYSDNTVAPGATLTGSADSVIAATDAVTFEGRVFAETAVNNGGTSMLRIGSLDIQVVPNVGFDHFGLVISTGAVLLSSPTTMEYNTWYDWALVGVDNFSVLFINGVAVDTDTWSLAVNSATNWLMFNSIAINPIYIDELRVTKSTRYLKNYTPSESAFPNM